MYIYFHNIHDFVKTVNALGEIRESLAKIFSKLGVRDIDANVLSHLLIMNREMSVCELAETLKCSVSGVTSALHRLMRIHLVVRKKEGRKYLYRSATNIIDVLHWLVQEILSYDIPTLKRKIEKILPTLKEERSMIQELEENIEKAEKYLTVLSELLKEYGEVV